MEEWGQCLDRLAPFVVNALKVQVGYGVLARNGEGRDSGVPKP